MPNVMSVLKAEITRLARKEAKAAVAPVRKPAGSVRRTIADLKRRLATLEQETRRLATLVTKIPTPQPEATTGSKARITAKGIRSLQRKLGLSRAEFAKLVGVSANNVYQWESKHGPLRVRETTRASILAVRDMGAREAKARLTEMAVAVKPGRRGKRQR